jgi:hypothetical protein
MFPELKNYLDDVESVAESTGEFLRKLNGARTRLRNAIEKSRQAVKDLKDDSKYFAQARNEIQKESLKVAKNTLVFNMRRAILTNNEFNEPPYRNALYRAIEDNDTYMFIRKGSGLSGGLKIDINMDKSGGRIHSWAAGIKAYRKVLDEEKEQKAKEKAKSKGKRYRKAPYNPISASRAWGRIFEGREGVNSKFQTTIRNRLELSGQVAPFWMLVNFGAIPMKSDRGGYPTPASTETNFVSDSEKEINEYIDRALIEARKRYYKLFEEYDAFINNEQERLLRLDELAQNIRLDRAQIRKLERQLGLEDKEINREKFEQVVQQVKKGILEKGRVDITASGSKKRTRISIGTIKEFYG